MLNCRNPRTFLIQPLGGSDIDAEVTDATAHASPFEQYVLLRGFDYRAAAVCKATAIPCLTTVSRVTSPAAVPLALLVAVVLLILICGPGQACLVLDVIGPLAVFLVALRPLQLVGVACLFDAGALGYAHASLIRCGCLVLIGRGFAACKDQQGEQCRENSNDLHDGNQE
jgi:hypothetical protein